jgi:hypothetical protein
MKKIIVLIIIGLFAIGLSAQNSGLGLGIILGEPTGISAKMWTNSNTAFDAAAAWSFGNEGALHLHADMLFHKFSLINEKFPVYYGFGARVKLSDDPNIGARIPIGIIYVVPNSKFDIFLEAVPVFDLLPDTRLNLNSALGVRYFF